MGKVAGKLVVLKFGEGSFEAGFPVTLRLGNEAEVATLELDGCLPGAPALLELTQTWQFSYRSRGSMGNFRQLKVPKAQVTRQRSSLVAVSGDLVQAMNQWLNGSGPFQKIRDCLLKTLSQQEPVRLVIQAKQLELWQLPWHLWDLLQEHSQVDVVFSLGNFAASNCSPSQASHESVRILVLLGDGTNIDIQTDLQLLTSQLPDAEFYIPTQVQRQQLCETLWEQSWDMLFFAGHSSSQFNEGRLYLDRDTYLTLEDLRYALQRAIANGLKLAMFNSCDGLELARSLADLHLPAAIVMRERIPDEAAQKFLHYFLEVFARHPQPLHLAVREAREKLHTALDDKYPCASWLPLVCQSPISPPLSWRSLYSSQALLQDPILIVDVTSNIRLPKPKSVRLQTILTMGIILSCGIWGVRSLGWIESAELWAYDQTIRLRPRTEQPDSRLLIVGVTQEDLNRYGYWDPQQHRHLLSDLIVAKLISTLQRHKPRIIGLDIIRDIPIDTGQTELLQELQHKTVISACKMPSTDGNHYPGYKSPPSIPVAQLGFINFPEEAVVRRHWLGMGSTDPKTCNTDHALSTRLAVRYLGLEKAEETPDKNIQIGTTVLPVLRRSLGGYRSKGSELQFGYQFLLNYRTAEKVANQVTLSQVLEGQVAPQFIQDKLILVGYNDPRANDHYGTPFTQDASLVQQQMPGVVIHAHMISQILSAVQDHRPLLYPWPEWAEAGWIGGWAMLGGLLFRHWRSLSLALASSMALGILGLSSFVLFCYGAWVPLIPAGLALAGSIGSLVIHDRIQSYDWQRKDTQT